MLVAQAAQIGFLAEGGSDYRPTDDGNEDLGIQGDAYKVPLPLLH